MALTEDSISAAMRLMSTEAALIRSVSTVNGMVALLDGDGSEPLTLRKSARRPLALSTGGPGRPYRTRTPTVHAPDLLRLALPA